MKKLLLFILASSISIASFAQTKWTVDPMHSFVNFSVKHMGISFVDGSFKKFDGTITAAKTDLTDATINFTIDVASINTSVEMRDNHLKSDDFFNAEKYPAMTFVSTSLKKIASKVPNKANKYYTLSGKLTIRDVTKDVKFMVTYGGTAKDQQGNTKAGFTATTKINRLDYNIKYDPTGAGIAKDVNITLNLEFVQAK
ncbi:polyisoprenoid-binding protein [Pedobacter sp. LMG 31464]|uniref:Polyisoprenoid-binding protein n=1 Tax=Pedobacter planticolens TaxID=2679964 RepID=A0A923E017_9SPHI|nr:YceI family protein [Pedobacter planticolens]MBB2146216.1 polyisoprenoid-binding protein [Pedobacter planticolens]